jgi:hypothetical protein
VTAWIACFAILLAAIAPTISHGFVANKDKVAGVSWLEICSASAKKFVKVADSQTPEKPSVPIEKSMHFEHCPFCLTHADALDLPPALTVSFALAAVPQSLPLLFYRAPRPLFMWAPAQSRAPPLSA